jgi:hypothetical protein
MVPFWVQGGNISLVAADGALLHAHFDEGQASMGVPLCTSLMDICFVLYFFFAESGLSHIFSVFIQYSVAVHWISHATYKPILAFL